MLTYGSLFAGIGGIDLGLDRAGMRCLWQVEIDEWCRERLADHWPEVPRFGDVASVGAHNLERVDLIAGGFPCQPVSQAGKRRGQDDERWLWPDFARVVRELRPRFVLVENVSGLLTPTRVDHADGSVLGWRAAPISEVVGDLAALGYDAEWTSIRASEVGAPHERLRVYVVAHARGWPWGRGGQRTHDAGRDDRGDDEHDAVGAQDGLGHADERIEPQEPTGDDLERRGRRERSTIGRRSVEPAGTRADGGDRGGDPAARAMADAGGSGGTQPQARGRQARGRTRDGGAGSVADSGGVRRERLEIDEGAGPAERGRPRVRGKDVADPARVGEREPTDEADAVAAGRIARPISRGGSAAPDVADADSERVQGARTLASSERESGLPPATHGGVADADDAGRRERRGAVAVRAQHAAAQRGGEARADDVADAARVGRAGTGRARDRRAGPTDRRDELDGTGATESGLGRVLDGLPDRMDPLFWPVPPGYAQWAWEPPRVAEGIPMRPRRLRGLGNAVVPQVIEWIGRRILRALELEAQAQDRGTA